MDAIRTEGLTKRYGSTMALESLDLAVAPGEVYGYLGPNGAGKTTTIRLLLGLHRPSAGRAVPLARADGRGDARVPGSPARGDGRGVPRRPRRPFPARDLEEGACSLE